MNTFTVLNKIYTAGNGLSNIQTLSQMTDSRYNSAMILVFFAAIFLAFPLNLDGQTPDESPVMNAQATDAPAFPIHENIHYKVKYLGVTCGHLYLGSSIEDFNGRPAYHLVMTARNSKFFNKIYKVDTRIDSWVDAQTLSTLVYESVSTEKGETSKERHEVNLAQGEVRSVEDGKNSILKFSGEGPVLDPLAFIFRLQKMAQNSDEDITLTLLTSKGPVPTLSTVKGPESRRTSRGRKQLLEIVPLAADGKMFSKKGEFSLWIDPAGDSTLYIVDFKLSFGRLIAKID